MLSLTIISMEQKHTIASARFLHALLGLEGLSKHTKQDGTKGTPPFSSLPWCEEPELETSDADTVSLWQVFEIQLIWKVSTNGATPKRHHPFLDDF